MPTMTQDEYRRMRDVLDAHRMQQAAEEQASLGYQPQVEPVQPVQPVQQPEPVQPVQQSVQPVQQSGTANGDDVAFQQALNAVDWSKIRPERTLGGTLKDAGITLANAAIGAGEGVVGLANLATLGGAGKVMDSIGYDAKAARDYLNQYKSAAQKFADREVEEAGQARPGEEGFGGAVNQFGRTLGAMWENPSTILTTAVESAPSMFLGGAVGKGAVKAASAIQRAKAAGKIGEGAATRLASKIVSPGGVVNDRAAGILAGVGEGVVAGGMQAEQIRQESPDRELTPRGILSAAAAGTFTGILGRIGNKISKRLGVTDVEKAIVSGVTGSMARTAGQEFKKMSAGQWAKAVTGGAITEGLFEELPQSAQEQFWSNFALERPLWEGIGAAAAQGMAAGTVMGGAANVYAGRESKQREAWNREVARHEEEARRAEQEFDEQNPSAGADVLAESAEAERELAIQAEAQRLEREIREATEARNKQWFADAKTRMRRPGEDAAFDELLAAAQVEAQAEEAQRNYEEQARSARRRDADRFAGIQEALGRQREAEEATRRELEQSRAEWEAEQQEQFAQSVADARKALGNYPGSYGYSFADLPQAVEAARAAEQAEQDRWAQARVQQVSAPYTRPFIRTETGGDGSFSVRAGDGSSLSARSLQDAVNAVSEQPFDINERRAQWAQQEQERQARRQEEIARAQAEWEAEQLEQAAQVAFSAQEALRNYPRGYGYNLADLPQITESRRAIAQAEEAAQQRGLRAYEDQVLQPERAARSREVARRGLSGGPIQRARDAGGIGGGYGMQNPLNAANADAYAAAGERNAITRARSTGQDYSPAFVPVESPMQYADRVQRNDEVQERSLNAVKEAFAQERTSQERQQRAEEALARVRETLAREAAARNQEGSAWYGGQAASQSPSGLGYDLSQALSASPDVVTEAQAQSAPPQGISTPAGSGPSQRAAAEAGNAGTASSSFAPELGGYPVQDQAVRNAVEAGGQGQISGQLRGDASGGSIAAPTTAGLAGTYGFDAAGLGYDLSQQGSQAQVAPEQPPVPQEQSVQSTGGVPATPQGQSVLPEDRNEYISRLASDLSSRGYADVIDRNGERKYTVSKASDGYYYIRELLEGGVASGVIGRWDNPNDAAKGIAEAIYYTEPKPELPKNKNEYINSIVFSLISSNGYTSAYDGDGNIYSIRINDDGLYSIKREDGKGIERRADSPTAAAEAMAEIAYGSQAAPPSGEQPTAGQAGQSIGYPAAGSGETAQGDTQTQTAPSGAAAGSAAAENLRREREAFTGRMRQHGSATNAEGTSYNLQEVQGKPGLFRVTSLTRGGERVTTVSNKGLPMEAAIKRALEASEAEEYDWWLVRGTLDGDGYATDRFNKTKGKRAEHLQALLAQERARREAQGSGVSTEGEGQSGQGIGYPGETQGIAQGAASGETATQENPERQAFVDRLRRTGPDRGRATANGKVYNIDNNNGRYNVFVNDNPLLDENGGGKSFASYEEAVQALADAAYPAKKKGKKAGKGKVTTEERPKTEERAKRDARWEAAARDPKLEDAFMTEGHESRLSGEEFIQTLRENGVAVNAVGAIYRIYPNEAGDYDLYARTHSAASHAIVKNVSLETALQKADEFRRYDVAREEELTRRLGSPAGSQGGTPKPRRKRLENGELEPLSDFLARRQAWQEEQAKAKEEQGENQDQHYERVKQAWAKSRAEQERQAQELAEWRAEHEAERNRVLKSFAEATGIPLGQLQEEYEAAEDGDIGDEIIKQGFLAPNGEHTNLTVEQWMLARLPSFKERYGDWENGAADVSLVLDANGEPVFTGPATVKEAGTETKAAQGEKSAKPEDTGKPAAEITEMPDLATAQKWTMPGKKALGAYGGKNYFRVDYNGSGEDTGYGDWNLTFFDFKPDVANSQKPVDFGRIQASLDVGEDGSVTGRFTTADGSREEIFNNPLSYIGRYDKDTFAFDQGRRVGFGVTLLDGKHVDAIMYYALKRYGVNADVQFLLGDGKGFTDTIYETTVPNGVVVTVNGNPFALVMAKADTSSREQVLKKVAAYEAGVEEAEKKKQDEAGEAQANLPVVLKKQRETFTEEERKEQKSFFENYGKGLDPAPPVSPKQMTRSSGLEKITKDWRDVPGKVRETESGYVFFPDGSVGMRTRHGLFFADSCEKQQTYDLATRVSRYYNDDLSDVPAVSIATFDTEQRSVSVEYVNGNRSNISDPFERGIPTQTLSFTGLKPLALQEIVPSGNNDDNTGYYIFVSKDGGTTILNHTALNVIAPMALRVGAQKVQFYRTKQGYVSVFFDGTLAAFVAPFNEKSRSLGESIRERVEKNSGLAKEELDRLFEGAVAPTDLRKSAAGAEGNKAEETDVSGKPEASATTKTPEAEPTGEQERPFDANKPYWHWTAEDWNKLKPTNEKDRILKEFYLHGRDVGGNTFSPSLLGKRDGKDDVWVLTVTTKDGKRVRDVGATQMWTRADAMKAAGAMANLGVAEEATPVKEQLYYNGTALDADGNVLEAVLEGGKYTIAVDNERPAPIQWYGKRQEAIAAWEEAVQRAKGEKNVDSGGQREQGGGKRWLSQDEFIAELKDKLRVENPDGSVFTLEDNGEKGKKQAFRLKVEFPQSENREPHYTRWNTHEKEVLRLAWRVTWNRELQANQDAEDAASGENVGGENKTAERPDLATVREWTKPGVTTFFGKRGYKVLFNGSGESTGYSDGHVLFFDFVPEAVIPPEGDDEVLYASFSDQEKDGSVTGFAALHKGTVEDGDVYDNPLTYIGRYSDKGETYIFELERNVGLGVVGINAGYVNAIMYYARKRYGKDADIQFIFTSQDRKKSLGTGSVAVVVNGKPFALVMPSRLDHKTKEDVVGVVEAYEQGLREDEAEERAEEAARQANLSEVLKKQEAAFTEEERKGQSAFFDDYGKGLDPAPPVSPTQMTKSRSIDKDDRGGRTTKSGYVFFPDGSVGMRTEHGLFFADSCEGQQTYDLATRVSWERNNDIGRVPAFSIATFDAEKGTVTVTNCRWQRDKASDPYEAETRFDSSSVTFNFEQDEANKAKPLALQEIVPSGIDDDKTGYYVFASRDGGTTILNYTALNVIAPMARRVGAQKVQFYRTEEGWVSVFFDGKLAALVAPLNEKGRDLPVELNARVEKNAGLAKEELDGLFDGAVAPTDLRKSAAEAEGKVEEAVLGETEGTGSSEGQTQGSAPTDATGVQDGTAQEEQSEVQGAAAVDFKEAIKTNLQAVSAKGTTYSLVPLKTKTGEYNVVAITKDGRREILKRGLSRETAAGVAWTTAWREDRGSRRIAAFVDPLGRDEMGEAPIGTVLKIGERFFTKRASGVWSIREGEVVGSGGSTDYLGAVKAEQEWERRNPREADRTRDPKFPDKTAFEQRYELLSLLSPVKRQEARDWGLRRLREYRQSREFFESRLRRTLWASENDYATTPRYKIKASEEGGFLLEKSASIRNPIETLGEFATMDEAVAAAVADVPRFANPDAAEDAASGKPEGKGKKRNKDKGIADKLGEHIGGSRADEARKTGTKESLPKWAKGYSIRKEESGKYVIYVGATPYRGFFAHTFEEALDYLSYIVLSHNFYAAPSRYAERGHGPYTIVGRTKRESRRGFYLDGVPDFATEQMAEQYAREHIEELVEKRNKHLEEDKAGRRPREKGFTEGDLVTAETSERTGKERRTGDATPDDFLSAFGFRGVEFGLWNNQKERQALLNDAYDALMDLADLLNIPAKAVSLNGELALAFGARGRGGKARAHFEPGKVVINLTKTSGKGSLAHEWMHALDNYFGRKEGGYDAISEMSKTSPRNIRSEVYSAFKKIKNAIEETPDGRRFTNYYRAAGEFNNVHYWRNSKELLARAFSAYIEDKLAARGEKSNFLSYGSNNEKYGKDWHAKPFPEGEEREAINKAFDEFFSTLKVDDSEGKAALYSIADDTVIESRPVRRDGETLADYKARLKAWRDRLKREVQAAVDMVRKLVPGLTVKTTTDLDRELGKLKGKVRHLRDADGQIVGAYHAGTKTVLLTPDADAGTVLHEIGWHAMYDWAKANAPELYRQMRRFALEAPEEVQAWVKERYGRFSAEGLLDEIGAKLFTEQGREEFENAVKSRASRRWYQRLADFFRELWGRFTGAHRADLGAYRDLTPEAAMKRLLSDILEGRRFGEQGGVRSEGRGAGRGDMLVRFARELGVTPEQLQREYDAVVAQYRDTDQWLKAQNGQDSNLNERQWVLVRTPRFKNWFGDWENDPENASRIVDGNGEPMVVYHGSPNGIFHVFDVGNKRGITDDWNTAIGSHFTYEKYVAERFAEGLYGKGNAPKVYPVFLNVRNPLAGEGGFHSRAEVRASELEYKTAYKKWEEAERERNKRGYHDEELLALIDEKGVSEAMRLNEEKKGPPIVPKPPLPLRDNALSESELLEVTTGKRWNEVAGLSVSKRRALGKKAREYLKSRGYDAVVYSNSSDAEGYGTTTLIVLDPTQVKSATENTGAFDPENPDIRYSFVDLAAAQRLDDDDIIQSRQAEYELARKMHDNGANPEEIKLLTNWELGEDGKWKYELVDKDMDFTIPGGEKAERKADEAFKRHSKIVVEKTIRLAKPLIEKIGANPKIKSRFETAVYIAPIISPYVFFGQSWPETGSEIYRAINIYESGEGHSAERAFTKLLDKARFSFGADDDGENFRDDYYSRVGKRAFIRLKSIIDKKDSLDYQEFKKRLIQFHETYHKYYRKLDERLRDLEEEAKKTPEAIKAYNEYRKYSNREASGKLSDFVSHDELFTAYPQLKGVGLSLEELFPTNGGYMQELDKDENGERRFRIVLNNLLSEDTLRTVVLHEIQHVIQEISGFAPGGSPRQFRDEAEHVEALNKAKVNIEVARDGMRNAIFENLDDKLVTRFMYSGQMLIDLKSGGIGGRDSASYLGKEIRSIDDMKEALISYVLDNNGKFPFAFESFFKAYSEEAYGKMERGIKDARAFLDDAILEYERIADTPYYKYLRLKGERESRAVEERINLTERERRERLTRQTLDDMDRAGGTPPPMDAVDSADSAARYSFAGERGAAALDQAEEATTRLDNLAIARQMEEAGKDAKTVKLATGWERGKDGKWRYEIDDSANKVDLRLARMDGRATLPEVLDAPELFKAYPQLRDVRVEIVNLPGVNGGKYIAAYNAILLSNTLAHDDERTTLQHEIQHAIQEIEGFARGGSPEAFRDYGRERLANEVYDQLQDIERQHRDAVQQVLEQQLPAYLREWTDVEVDEKGKFSEPYNIGGRDVNSIREMAQVFTDRMVDERQNPETALAEIVQAADGAVHDFFEAEGVYDKSFPELNRITEKYKAKRAEMEAISAGTQDPLKTYQRLAGEAESRNVERRLSMTAEERRASLAEETEDVAREDQIVLNEMLGNAASAARPANNAVPERNRADIEAELEQELGAARTRKLTGARNGRVAIVDSQEEARRIIAGASGDTARKSTSTAIAAKYPNWMDNQVITTDGKKGQQTQIEGTRGTYAKLGRWIQANLGMNVQVLDASSGMGLGTVELREQGFATDDIEPYPGKVRMESNPPTFSGTDAYQQAMNAGKQYDFIISNAVLNVIPDDWRNAVLRDMAALLKPGGKMFINTRKAGEEKSIKNKIELDSPQEVLVGTPDRITSYQRFFTPKGLVEYVQEQLGDGYTVEVANAKNSGTSGLAAVVVTKKGEAVSAKAKDSRLERAAPDETLYSVSAKGGKTKIARSKYGVGKAVGRRIYFHKQYAGEIVPAEALKKAQAIAAREGFAYNTMMYDESTGLIRFDEAPDFDSAREPVTGRSLSVFPDGKTKYSNGSVSQEGQIWHHKWLWVKDDYKGFDVAESRSWSKTWLNANAGKGAPSGYIEQWNQRLNDIGLGGYIVESAQRPEVRYSEDGRTIQGFYLNGKVYLVRDGIAKGQTMPVLMHELGEHAAQLGFANNVKYRAILKSLENRKDEKSANGEAIRAAMQRAEDAGLTQEDKHYWSEVAAYMVEQYGTKKASLLDKIVNFFKELLYRVGAISADKFGQKDLALFAQAAVRAEARRAERTAGERDTARYSFAGERGAAALDQAEEATTRLDNLAIAREMEEAGKDAKTVKLATGWERGKDGKWRYEVDDSKTRVSRNGDIDFERVHPGYKRWKELNAKRIASEPFSETEDKEYSELNDRFEELLDRQKRKIRRGEAVLLREVMDAPELFKAYPQLQDFKVEVSDEIPPDDALYISAAKTIVLGESVLRGTPIYAEKLRTTLHHEIQHAIQEIEGFAKGGNPEQFRHGPMFSKRARDLNSDLSYIMTGSRMSLQPKELIESMSPAMIRGIEGKLESVAKNYGFDTLEDAKAFLLKEDDKRTPFGQYNRLAGEVESRNVQTRIGMTPEERRASLASETEDVAREDQIVLQGMLGGAAASMAKPKTGKEAAERIMSLFQTAYHGSPHQFDAFTLDNIGGGEGSQVHGWGLYFALDRRVSEKYKLNRKSVEYLVLRTLAAEEGDIGSALVILEEMLEDRVYMIEYDVFDELGHTQEAKEARERYKNYVKKLVEKYGEDGRSWPEDEFSRLKQLGKARDDAELKSRKRAEIQERAKEILADDEEYRRILAAIKILQEEDIDKIYSGRLYRVDIPEDSEMLREDASLADQPEQVKQSLERVFREHADDLEDRDKLLLAALQGNGEITGKTLYWELADALGSPKAASLALNEAGIKGIRYDGRSDGECAVVWDDTAIEILEIYYQAQKDGLNPQEALRKLYGQKQAEAGERAMQEAGEAPGLVPHREKGEDLKDYLKRRQDWAQGQKGELWRQVQKQIRETLKDKAQSGAIISIIEARAASAGISAEEYVARRGLEIRQQRGVEGLRGGFNANLYRDEGRAIISAFEGVDVSTLAHELAHLFRQDLERFGQAGLLETAEKWAGVQGGKWTREQEERFAEAFETYLYEGKAPTEKLEGVFARFRAWLAGIYRALTGSPLSNRLSPEITRVFDALLTEGAARDVEQAGYFGGGNADNVLYQATPTSNSGIRGWIDRLLDNAAPDVRDRWERFVYNFLDTNDPRERIWAAAGKDADHDIVTVERLRGKKAAAESEAFRERMVKPLLATLAKAKLKASDLEEYAHALHVPERNQRMREVNAKRYLDSLLHQMTGSEAKPFKDQIELIQKQATQAGWTSRDKHLAYLQMMDQVFSDIPTRELVVQAMPDSTEREQKLKALAAKRLERTKRIKKKWDEESPRFAGMTDKEAQSIIVKWHKDSRFAKLQDAHSQLRDITKMTLAVLHEGGELSDEEYDDLLNGYLHYVPLHRAGFMDTAPATGRITGPTGKPLKVAKGSMREVVNILPEVLKAHETAISRKHKLLAGRVLYEWALANPDAGITVESIPKEPTHDKEGNIVMYPSQQEPPDGVFVKVDGQKHLLRFAVDPKTPEGRTMERFLDSIKGTDAQLGGITKGLHRITRWLAAVNTMYSPEFVISNFARDLQTALVHLNQEDINMDGLQKQVLSDIPKALRGIWQSERGKGKGKEWSNWYKDFGAHGGKVGWMQGYEGIDEIVKTIEQEMKLAGDGHHLRKGFENVKNFIESANKAVENCLRLATYKAMVERGVARDRAALVASGLTVDFTQHGKLGPQINALYLFFNASVQGTVRMGQAMAKSKRVRQIAGALAGLGFMLQMLALAGGGDDDTGEPYILGIPEYERQRSIIIMLPGQDGRYIKIPKAYGYGALYDFGAEIANSIYMSATGRRYDHAKGAMRVVSSLANSFNPVHSATMLQTLAPTLVDPAVYVAENKTWSGQPLMPEQNQFGPQKPDSQRVWKSTGPAWRTIAETANSITGGDTYEGGLIDVSPETLEMLWDNALGSAGRFVGNVAHLPATLMQDETDISKIPFARTVTGKWSDRTISNRYHDAMERAQIANMRFKNAETLEERRQIFQGDDYILFRRTHEIDKRVKRLRNRLNQIEAAGNTAGAEYIHKQILSLQKRALQMAN